MAKSAKGTPTDTTRNRHPDDFHPRVFGLSDDEDRSLKPPFTDWAGAVRDSTRGLEAQPQLFHRRVSTRLPDSVKGQHLAFTCITDDGGFYFCKEDRNGHPARATEWLATRLARHVGIPTAECAVVEDAETGEQFFGSKRVPSIADSFAVSDFLNTPHSNELGGVGLWPGQFLAMLRAFDHFIDNPDRGPHNFVLARDGSQTNLCPIDFASARLFQCTADRFPLESERTIFVGKLHRLIHGHHPESAGEMLNRLAAVPASVVNGFLEEMPESWLTDHHRGALNEFWSDGRRDQRLKNLHAELSG